MSSLKEVECPTVEVGGVRVRFRDVSRDRRRERENGCRVGKPLVRTQSLTRGEREDGGGGIRLGGRKERT